MTPDQVKRVQESFALIAPEADRVAAVFYSRLFEIAPSVEPLFRGDMAEQRRKLIAMLATVVNSLSDLPAVLPAASALAKRHLGYGVEPQHYAKVGQALIWTLQQGLGPAWTAATADAWITAYMTLSDFMIAEAYSHPLAAE